MTEGLYLGYCLTILASGCDHPLPDTLVKPGATLRIKVSPVNVCPIYLHHQDFLSYQPAESMGNMFPMEVLALERRIMLPPGVSLTLWVFDTSCLFAAGRVGDHMFLSLEE